MKKRQKNDRYCGERCEWRADNARRTQRKREKAWAAMAGYRSEWMPSRGSGYREERVPWERDERSAVVRERTARPNRLPEGFKSEADFEIRPWWEQPREAEPAAESETVERTATETPAPPALREQPTPKPRDMERYWHDLLIDESKWRDW
jgi:hypothetical protein